jgi:hypothetical protein
MTVTDAEKDLLSFVDRYKYKPGSTSQQVIVHTDRTKFFLVFPLALSILHFPFPSFCNVAQAQRYFVWSIPSQEGVITVSITQLFLLNK